MDRVRVSEEHPRRSVDGSAAGSRGSIAAAFGFQEVLRNGVGVIGVAQKSLQPRAATNGKDVLRERRITEEGQTDVSRSVRARGSSRAVARDPGLGRPWAE